MRPAFDSEKHGYSKRQVDEYIDKIRAENKQISLNNDQLFLLWITELNKMPSAYDYAPGNSIERDAASWRKLQELLQQSAPESRGNRQPVRQQPSFQEEEFIPRPPMAERSLSKKKKSRVTGFIFYAVIIALVLGVYFFAGDNTAGPPRTFMGYAAMTVLSRSMQDVIPEHSLIVVRQTDPAEIEIDDDITFLTFLGSPNDPGSEIRTITHRVIGIGYQVEDDPGSGVHRFYTQGYNNAQPDPEPVLAEHVVGVVIFHNLILGQIVTFIRTFSIFIVIFIVLIVGLIAVLRMIFAKDTKGDLASQME